MTRKIPLLALGLGMALASAQAFAHGNHSHGPALTEVERQASEGISTCTTGSAGERVSPAK